MKKQLVIIHGGSTFDTYEEYMAYLNSVTLTKEKINAKDWKDSLSVHLPEVEVLYPKMPNAKNARYLEWKIWFEKLFPLLENSVILVGHSLGGIFLAKYLTENDFPKEIEALHLVAAPYDAETCQESLADFALNHTVEKLKDLTSKVFLYHSKDDTSVPFADVEKYVRDLPTAILTTFEDRGHFTQANFEELILNIKENSL